MTQPSAANAKMVDKNNNPQIADRGSAIADLTDSTTGTVSDTVDYAFAGANDDIASLAAKINAILAILRNQGFIAD